MADKENTNMCSPKHGDNNSGREPHERPFSTHTLSDSDDDERDFLGFQAIHRSKRKRSKSSDRTSPSPMQPRSSREGRMPVPSWWNTPYPPGPWQFMPPMPYWPHSANYPDGTLSQDHRSDDGQEHEEEMLLGDDDCHLDIPEDATSLASHGSSSMSTSVSLDKHLELASVDEDIGPDVNPKVANLITKIWDKDQKPDIKSLFTDAPRPGNVPCLQKVDLDEEILTDLAKRPQTKELDFSLRGIHHTITRAAITVTGLLNNIFDGTASKQQLADKAVSTLRILSYGAQNCHTLRKNQIKPVLLPEVKNKLCARNASIAAINESHLLFGGDVPAKVKNGELEYTLTC